MLHIKRRLIVIAAIAAIFPSQALNAQEKESLPVKCKYAFEDFRIYCLVLKNTVLISNVRLEDADPIWCPKSPLISLPTENNFAEKVYDRGKVIRINLGSRCSITGFSLDVGGKSYQFNGD